MSTRRWCAEWRGNYFSRQNRRHRWMQLWVGFGTGKHFRYYRINSICQELAEEKARALPLFTPSQVLIQHLISAVKAKRQPLLDSPARLRMDYFVPSEFTSAAFRLIERFTSIMYDSTTSYDKVNDLRQEASMWINSLKPITAAANPEVFGWTWEDTGWRPVWTTLPAAAVGCRELIKCGCKAKPDCAKKCIYRTAGLTCTALCLTSWL